MTSLLDGCFIAKSRNPLDLEVNPKGLHDYLNNLPAALAALGVSREVDLGIVSAVDCATLGPQVLLSLAADDIAYGSKAYVGNVQVDNPTKMLIGTLDDLIGDGASEIASLDDGDMVASYFQPGVTNLRINTHSPVLRGPIDVVAAWQTGTTAFIVDTAPVAWQALHAFAEGQWHVDSNNHLQHVTGAGTSGAAEPTWDDTGSTTTDGSVEWTDEGLIPTVGECHLSVTVAKLV